MNAAFGVLSLFAQRAYARFQGMPFLSNYILKTLFMTLTLEPFSLRSVRLVRRLLGILLFLNVPLGLAQDLSADEVLSRTTESAQTLQNAEFLLTGMLVDPDGSEVALEVQIQVVPGENLARADFFQPDALADNFVIFDNEDIYNYVFLTNQISIFKADDPNALGGLFPDTNVQQGLEFNLDLEQLFSGWDVSKEGYEDGRYSLKFMNSNELSTVSYVLASIVDETWQPYSLRFFGSEGNIIADIIIENFERDTVLDAEDVRYYPDDAEIIDER